MAKYVLRAIQFTTLSIAAGTLTLKLAIAQNVDDTTRAFGGLIRPALTHAAQVEWHKIPPNQITCIDRGLRQQGASVATPRDHALSWGTQYATAAPATAPPIVPIRRSVVALTEPPTLACVMMIAENTAQ
jgi:hypothetical protein